jgi:hypothetical protein
VSFCNFIDLCQAKIGQKVQNDYAKGWNCTKCKKDVEKGVKKEGKWENEK